MENGYEVSLVNTSAVRQYEGLKYTDDRHDARWLAHLLRLGVLPTGYIYPQEDRAVRDLLRRRRRLVQERTAGLLALKNLFARNLGEMLPVDELRAFEADDVPELVGDPNLALAIQSTIRVGERLDEEIDGLEKAAYQAARDRPELEILLSIPGVGRRIGLTILYETGDIRRFKKVGNYASSCRCVSTDRRSDERSKGKGNRKNGNPYLSWAFAEAAVFVARFQRAARKYLDRKTAKTHPHRRATRSRPQALESRVLHAPRRDLLQPALLFG
jgi:transposase